MSIRLATSLAVLAAAIGSPALAADWGEDWSPEEVYRGAYSTEPKDWSEMGDESDGIHIETGLRYWYSWGSQNYEVDGQSFESTDNAHTVEAHIRVEEDATRTYAKGWAGYSAAITGGYSDPSGSGDVTDGVLGYAGADFGWNALGDGKGTGVGGFVGYNYWNNSPRTSRYNFTTATSAADVTYSNASGNWSVPGDSVDDKIELHMLRLGLSGKAEFNEFLDISAEVAAVPFSTISGVLGGHAAGGGAFGGPGCNVLPPDSCAPEILKGSATEINGWGYGAMGEIMAGIKPMENLTLRVGGRAWYVNGTYDATWTQVSVTAPQIRPPVPNPDTPDPNDTMPPDPLYSAPTVSTQQVISTENPFSLFRYGLLAELTYSF
ncbi:hypothetical protein [Devosia sp. Root105]|uniref:hypothetical protein n=1 Tax=Devosia sp. Root105 TaxID=1736423 RepID=UPI000700CCA2|nr:hypothetical protein [Devosia sp. Root105]KQU99634.1 hypothetical protein ASC68_09885 [Devosia sp. Root105]